MHRRLYVHVRYFYEQNRTKYHMAKFPTSEMESIQFGFNILYFYIFFKAQKIKIKKSTLLN